MAHSYDWEAGIEPIFGDEIDEINDKMPDSFPYEVIGIAVGNRETGEAAFFCRMLDACALLEADYLQDVLGDVSEAYEMSLSTEEDQEARLDAAWREWQSEESRDRGYDFELCRRLREKYMTLKEELQCKQ